MHSDDGLHCGGRVSKRKIAHSLSLFFIIFLNVKPTVYGALYFSAIISPMTLANSLISRAICPVESVLVQFDRCMSFVTESRVLWT